MVSLRTYAGKRQRKTSTAASPAAVTGQFDSRSFGTEMEAESTAVEPGAGLQYAKLSSLNAAYVQAQRFGHHLSQISVHAAPSADIPVGRRKRRREETNGTALTALESVQREAEAGEGFEADTHLENRIKADKDGGQPLDKGVRSFMEPRFGHSFANVRVHTNSHSVQMNQELNAQAFTNGNHIYFGKGKYEPHSDQGKHLLAHELTHTIQQTGGSQLQRKKGGHCTSCGCPTCAPTSLRRSINPQSLLNRKFSDRVQRQADSASHGAGCACPSCGTGGQVQTKLTVGPARDQYEQEADTVASQVINMPDPTRRVQPVQHQAGGGRTQRQGDEEQAQRQGDEEQAQTQVIGATITPIAQRHEKTDDRAQKQPIGPSITPLAGSRTGSGRVQRHNSWEHKLLGDIPPEKLTGLGSWQDLLKEGAQRDIAEVDVDGKKIKKGNVMHVIAQELSRLDHWQQNPPKGTSEADKKTLDPTWDVVLVSLPNSKKPLEPTVVTYGELNTLADYYGNAELMKSADPEKRYQLIQSVRQETFFKLKEIYDQLKTSLSDEEKQDADVGEAETMMGQNKLLKKKAGFKFKGAVTPDSISSLSGQLDLLLGLQKTGTKEKTNEYSPTLGRNACHFVPESWHAWAQNHQKALHLARLSWTQRERVRDFQEQLHAEDFSRRPLDAQEIKVPMLIAKNKADQLANEALVENGFGDHYLQDSYASGHMLNKTQIMQWYIEYIDKTNDLDYFKDENWRKVQQMSHGRQQGLVNAQQYNKKAVRGTSDKTPKRNAQNPQSVEDLEGGWINRFNALGLQTPPSITPGSTHFDLFVWWQQQAMGALGSRKQTVKSLKASGKSTDVYSAIKALEADGVIRKNWGGTGHHVTEDMTNAQLDKLSFLIRDDYVPKRKNAKEFNRILAAYYNKGNKEQSPTAKDDAAKTYTKMAASVTYGDYLEFMKSSLIQKSTNALHDTFCKDGLEVSNKKEPGTPLFKVYGDDAMFNAESGRGVKHSGETSNMSRDAVLQTAATGKEGDNTTDAIMDRLPTYVKPTKESPLTSIEEWHNPPKGGPSLKRLCFTDIFPKMAWKVKQKLAPGVLSPKLGTISKDVGVHGGDAF